MSKLEKGFVLLAVALWFAVGFVFADYRHQANATGDVNRDGVVNAQDLSIVLSHWTVTANGAGNQPVAEPTVQVQNAADVNRQSGNVLVR